jgi:hypothetical protein
MARFYFPFGSYSTGTSEDGDWALLGGTVSDPQPTFIEGTTPLFFGHYTRTGNLCHIAIDVDMDNILTFGTGQYYMTLPFNAEHTTIISNGALYDYSASKTYNIAGRIATGTNILELYSVGSNGQYVLFSDSNNSPIRLAKEDSFYISGTYEVEHA